MKIFQIVALLSLAGCSVLTYPPYVVPEGQPNASLTIHGMANTRLVVFAFDEAETCSGTYKVGDLITSGPADKIKTKIPAGKEFAYSLFPLTLGHSCQMPFSFTPRAGADYVAFLRYDASSYTCQAALMERKEDGKLVKVNDVVARKFNAWTFGGNNFCHKKSDL